MRRRIFALPALVALVLSAQAATAAPPTDPTNVPAGVSAGGVDVSGLTLAAAEAKLAQDLAGRFDRPVVLGVAGRIFKLEPAADAQFAFDALTTAKRALRAEQPGTVPLKITHTKAAVRTWVDGVNKGLYKAPRNARIKLGLRRQTVTGARHGRSLEQRKVADAISAQLADENAPRYVRTKLVKVTPKVTVNGLRRQYGTIVTVDKSNFRLRLFKRLKLARSYGVAVGQPAYPTPSGTFRIANKQVNPTWSVPNSPWAGELAGTSVQGGTAANPLKARWMGIVNGVGIHGTGEEGSIGSRASHGCIRMRVRDVVALYKRVPVGTTVVIR